MKNCPKCGNTVSDAAQDCSHCGVNFLGYQRFVTHQAVEEPATSAVATPATVGGAMAPSLAALDSVAVQQREDAFRIVTGWQTLNRYAILSMDGAMVGYIAERDQGFLAMIERNLMGPRRSLLIDVFDLQGRVIASFQRPMYFIYSKMSVTGPSGERMGQVSNTFALFKPNYELEDSRGLVFATLESSFLGGETMKDSLLGNRNFTVVSSNGEQRGGSITRSWNGVLNRIFTENDTYTTAFEPGWSLEKKLLLIAASINIDLNLYESEEGGRSGLLSLISLDTVLNLFLGRKDD